MTNVIKTQQQDVEMSRRHIMSWTKESDWRPNEMYGPTEQETGFSEALLSVQHEQRLSM